MKVTPSSLRNSADSSAETVRLLALIDEHLSRWSSWAGNAPKAAGLLVLLIAVGIALASRFPPYVGENERSPGSFARFADTNYGQAITWWLDHPFQTVPANRFFPNAAEVGGVEAGRAAHLDKLPVRPVLPLLNQLTGLGVATILIANHLAMLGLFWLVYTISSGGSRDPAQGALATWTYAACWAAGWGLEDFIFGDVVAVAFLLAGCRGGAPWAFGCFLVGGFTDERALIATPLAALLRWRLQISKVESDAMPARMTWQSAVAPAIAALVVYGVIRVTLAWVWDVRSGTSMMAEKEILLYHFFASFPAKVFRIWEFLWIYPIAMMVISAASADRMDRRFVLPYALAFGCALVPAILVWDIDRSLTYLLPGVVLAVAFLPLGQTTRRLLLAGTALGSFLWVEFFGTALRYLVI